MEMRCGRCLFGFACDTQHPQHKGNGKCSIGFSFFRL
ncbi:hypothetical protein FOCG_17904 [Fusarium oxysporum f. sp. radicis-lycopersici 26381]|nr:hypothetical protein FOCG_17904 [Fusarium oxysporum f. sp. radicis-lycopersici 26381]